MIRLFLALAVVVALVLIAYDRQDNQPVQASDQKMETGWEDLDSLIDDNVPDAAQATIVGTVRDSASSMRGFGNSMLMEFSDTIQRK